MESPDPPEPDAVGGPAEKTSSGTWPFRALGLITLAGAAGFALILLMPGLGHNTRIALSFILAPVVVTPLIGLPTLGMQTGYSRGSLVVGSVLGGEFAAALQAAGQSGRFSQWLIVIETAAMLLAPLTLQVLRAARIPGVWQGEAVPSLTGIALIIVLAPFALLAGILDGMAKFPIPAAIGAVLAGVSTGFAAGLHPVQTVLGGLLAAVLALFPAAIRRVLARTRQPRG
jgi:hypothetical protein